MALPDAFQFSQSSLQDYVDCPRRFQLRHILMQPWPMPLTEDSLRHDLHVHRARAFHRLAHQYVLGIAPRSLCQTIHDETLSVWWDAFLNRPPACLADTPDLPDPMRRGEVVLSAPLAGYRLVATVDLLACEPSGRVSVVDWKTVLKRPRRAGLARRLQTRVYCYMAVETGSTFNSREMPKPELVEMVYWFAAFGGATERFPYDSGQYASDREYLRQLVLEIAARQESTWTLTSDERRCRFCNYRSLCERDVVPGFLEELDEDLELAEISIDLEQVAEIEF
jgi:hypothetical protein